MTQHRKEHEFDVALFLAFKNVAYKKAMLLMIIGIISLGYLSTMFSSAIISGLKFTIEQKVITGTTGHVIIQPEEGKDFLTDIDSIEKKVLSVPGVVAASPRLDAFLTLRDKEGNSISALTKIIDPDKEFYTTDLAKNIMDGEYLSEGMPEVLLGAELTKAYRMMPSSEALDIKAGDMIDVTLEYGGRRIDRTLKVRGVYGQSFMFTDGFVYISRQTVEDIFGVTGVDAASTISVKAVSRGDEDRIVDELRGLSIRGRIWRWYEKMDMLDQFTDSLMIIANLTAAIGVIIAFATIYIMVYINVLQKRSQIGMLKAIGITENTILLSYMIQSLVYGALGSIFGMILTKLVLGYIDMNPIDMPLGLVRPVAEAMSYFYSSMLLVVSSVVAGYMASGGVIKEKILEAIFRG